VSFTFFILKFCLPPHVGWFDIPLLIEIPAVD
jgi:hypothetical protein